MIRPAIFFSFNLFMTHNTCRIDDDVGGDAFENNDDAVNVDDDDGDNNDDMECVLSIDTLNLRILYP